VTVIGLTPPAAPSAPGLHVAVNPVMAAPPFEAGAVKAIVAWPAPGVAAPMVGAPGTAGAMVIEKFWVVVPPELVAVTTPVKVPADVGVPPRFGPLKVTPGGNAPDVRLKVGPGEPLATYTCAYAEPNVPLGGAALVNAGPDTGTTLTVPDAAPVPTALVAVTEQVYDVPAARPVTVTGDAAAVPVKAPGLQVAVNPVIAEPPFDAGGVKLMEAWPLPGVAMPMVGAPGAVAAIAIEKFCVAVPAELVAVTTPVKVPLAFGVPESVPADAFSVRPPGNAPEVRLKVGAGEPLAVKVCE